MIKKSAANKEYMLPDNMHLPLRQKDKTSVTRNPGRWGSLLSGTKYIDGKFFPFTRFANTKDGGSLLQKSIATENEHRLNPKGSLISFGKVKEIAIADGLDIQHIIEASYCIQLSRRLALSPDIQHIINPYIQ